MYRVADSCILYPTASGNVAEALRHATFDAGCDIILISGFGLAQPDPAIAAQLDSAYENGVIVVVPAGEIFSTMGFPARYPRPITVSGTTPTDLPWSAAARGIAVDICAPATDIDRADVILRGGSFRAIYRRAGTGTAYAAAQIAGSAALWLAFQRGQLYRLGNGWARVEAFRTCLAQSARKPADWDDRLWGSGILDVMRLIAGSVPTAAQLLPRSSCAEYKF